ncbi:ATP-binding protein [Streptomyces sp. NPDC048278]|uniref:ATP-binding protein n=1 Tax=Streptomyces sp. NPDC048278 TaxID=3155809 RepID=UPI0034284512
MDWGLALGISTADFAAHAFSKDPESVQSIRCFVRETLAGWGLRACANDLTNVANELAVNAAQHALSQHGEPDKAWLGLAHTGGTVVCAVTDPSPKPPSRRSPQHLAAAGRGLVIVDALTSQWGYARTHSGGKIVWARIATPHA